MARTPDQELDELRSAGLLRAMRVLDSAQGAEVLCGGRWLCNFSSNDYLGLAAHPVLGEAAKSAFEHYGFGSGASRLICGTMRPHRELEEELAAFKSAHAAMAFTSGYATGTGVLGALLGKDDIVLADKLAHACLIDGARACGATLRVFQHNRMDQLESMLRSIRSRSADNRILIVTESVFSMDGDICPLADIVRLKNFHGAWLLLDEAHATGVIGPEGRGLAAHLGLSGEVELQMGTLSKALGCHGGYLAASKPLVNLLWNRARPLIYTTAPPPMLSAAALAALKLCRSAEGSRLRSILEHNRRALAAALGKSGAPPAAILPHIVGAAEAAVDLSSRLEEQRILATAIRYPTVAMGKARIRFTVTANHKPEHFSALRDAWAASLV